MLTTFKNFLDDAEAWDMFITGPAGSGKTTSLREGVEYCIANDIPYIVCAYTHKACGILRSKLPEKANVATLHSFLKKRPTINTNATNRKHLQSSTKSAPGDQYKVLFLDEYSMVGEKDYMDLRDAQDEDYDGNPTMKVVWIGDDHQLPPVGDVQSIIPEGDYQVHLMKIWRNDNPLQGPLNKLIQMIDGGKPEPLEDVQGYFIRDMDLISEYSNCTQDKCMLAYTNRRVEELNAMAQGRAEPEANDTIFSPTTQRTYSFVRWVPPVEVTEVARHWQDPLLLGSKYKTLEHLLRADICDFVELDDEEGERATFAAVFGHYQYKLINDRLGQAAVEANKAIEAEFKGYRAAAWAKANHTHPLARQRSKAWRDYLAFKECVICIDFANAMTVHKSQGSTFHTVFLDMQDLYICAERDFTLYLKLAYVGISRASDCVITN